MKSKKQKVLRTKNRLFLTISLSTLALILIGVVTYQWILNKSDTNIDYNLTTKSIISNWFGNRLTPSQRIEDQTKTENSIILYPVDNKITYTIPSGWKKESGLEYSNSETVKLTSPNYLSDDPVSGVSQGLEVLFSASSLTKGQTLESEKEYQLSFATTSDMQDTQIDGMPTIKYHTDWAGHLHCIQYFVIRNDYTLYISFTSKDLDTERSYQTEIDSIINSIRFK